MGADGQARAAPPGGAGSSEQFPESARGGVWKVEETRRLPRAVVMAVREDDDALRRYLDHGLLWLRDDPSWASILDGFL